MGLYDTYLAVRLRASDADLPETVAVLITERDLLDGGYGTLSDVLTWAVEFDAERVVVYVSVLDEEAVPSLRADLATLDTPRELDVRGPDDHERADAPVQVSIGLGGKSEFAAAVRAIAEDVAADEIIPDEIAKADIEDRLVFPTDPDLVIKTGAERLSDFMIWQSVYSELYFTDVNWQNFRRREYLRALRDYQDRQRRFGR
ncbi:UDP diphosphate synthase [Halobacteriales archaeon SW_10_68_16]|nr:MAG: UDP diphosphate synthase [Halobacteriales archaeon SW_10_68_16]